MMDALIYDVEVLRGPDEVKGGWDNPEAMGFGTAIIYDTTQDLYLLFGPEDHHKIIDYIRSRQENGFRLVGFNHVRFDNRVIFGNRYKQYLGTKIPEGLEEPYDIDLMLRVVQRKFNVKTVAEAQDKYGHKTVHDGSIGLNGIARGTFGMQKTGHGSFPPMQIRRGEWAKVYAYNLHDVRLTRKVWEFGLEKGYIIDGRGNTVEVDFESTPGHQQGKLL